MTKLPSGSALVRETDVFERGDAIVVELHPKHMCLRLKGQDRTHAVDVGYAEIRKLGLLRAGRAHGRQS